MRYKMLLCTVVMALPLSACWKGPNFYSVSESVRAIPAGKYKVVDVYSASKPSANRFDDPEFGSRLKIGYEDDGRVIINNDTDDPAKMMLVPLKDRPNTFVAQIEMDALIARTSAPGSVYGLVQVRGDRYRVSLPLCDGTRRLKPGSSVIVKGLLVKGRVCSFDDKETFERAMVDYANDPLSWTEYKRVADKKRSG